MGRSGETRRRWLPGWRSIVPRFPEPLSPELYRLSGKMRLIAVVVLTFFNFTASTQLDRMGADVDLYWRHMAFMIPLWGADTVIALALWRGRLATATMRRLTFVCIVLESGTTVKSLQLYGTVNSHLLVYAVVLILVYRLFFDLAIGAFMFLTMLAGLWAMVIAETAGWLTPQAILPPPPDGIYRTADREIGAAAMQTGVLILLFLLANWVVARLRHRELTIRLLREELIARETGQVGRHSGRILRDTYRLGALIGSGGMGEVYAGEHQRTRRPVAVKLLHPHMVDDEALLRRFRREAEVTGRLGSRHIVSVLDVDQDDGQPFLVLELLDGESLADRIRRDGPLAGDLVVDLLDQIAAGLQIAHRAGVVHRDLKPENLFLCRGDGGELVKILDFGVSKIRDDATALTREAALIGTPDFMAPEQAVGRVDEVDHRADLFALGGIVYHALTGHRPFEASSVPAQLRRICDEEPVPLARLRPDLPAAVGDVLAIAMAKRADQRYQDVGELVADLRAAIAGAPGDGLAARAAAVTRGRPASVSSVPGDPSISPVADTHAADAGLFACIHTDLMIDKHYHAARPPPVHPAPAPVRGGGRRDPVVPPRRRALRGVAAVAQRPAGPARGRAGRPPVRARSPAGAAHAGGPAAGRAGP